MLVWAGKGSNVTETLREWWWSLSWLYSYAAIFKFCRLTCFILFVVWKDISSAFFGLRGETRGISLTLSVSTADMDSYEGVQKYGVLTGCFYSYSSWALITLILLCLRRRCLFMHNSTKTIATTITKKTLKNMTVMLRLTSVSSVLFFGTLL